MIFGKLLSLDWQRRTLARKGGSGPYWDYLSVPFPGSGTDCRDIEFVALDLETTGLDAAKHDIISVGFVIMRGLRIDLTTARHRLVRPNRTIPERTAIIHAITDDMAAAGRPLESVMSELLQVLAGRVLIAHHAPFELKFLGAACKQLFGYGFLAPVVDTQWIARRRLEQRNRAYSARELRLSRLRDNYNLPRYRAHNALSDALAAAELFAAQVAEAAPEPGHLPLKRFLCR